MTTVPTCRVRVYDFALVDVTGRMKNAAMHPCGLPVTDGGLCAKHAADRARLTP